MDKEWQRCVKTSSVFLGTANGDFGQPAAKIPEMRKDIREVTKADLDGFDAVVHLAALSNDPLGNLDPGLTYDIIIRLL